MDSWYRCWIMVLTAPMVLTQTHCIVSVLLNHTHTRGQGIALMRDFSTTPLIVYQVCKDYYSIKKGMKSEKEYPKIGQSTFLWYCESKIFNYVAIRKITGNCPKYHEIKQSQYIHYIVDTILSFVFPCMYISTPQYNKLCSKYKKVYILVCLWTLTPGPASIMLSE